MTQQQLSPRMQRIADAIQREVSVLLVNEIDDRRIKHVQLTHVIVSKDLSIAKIYFIPGNTDEEPEKLTKLLNKTASFLRFNIAKHLDLRVTPELKFYFDEQGKKTQHLLDLLEKI